MIDYCALCGRPLIVLEHGATKACHKGLGYVTDAGVDPMDAWAAWTPLRNGLWFFMRPGYPRK